MKIETYVISIYEYDEHYEGATDGYINVYETDGNAYNNFLYSNYQITSEQPDTDNEDFNDTARWLAKTLLKIKEFEAINPLAHCDWTADYEKDKETGKYIFKPIIMPQTKEKTNE